MPEHGLRQWTTAHRGGLAIFVGYLVAAVVVTLGAWRGPASGWAGTCCDQEPAIWYLGWTPHALAHGLDPFFTTQIGAPAGVNLMWSPSMPLLGILGWLPAKIAGPIVGFNVLVVLGIALSGFTAWLAIRRWSGDGAGPIVGGAVYAFSPYVVSHAAIHLNLATAWVPPLLLIAIDELLVTRRRPPWQSGVVFGVLCAAQLLISEEILATSVVAAGVLTAVMAVACRGAQFRQIAITRLVPAGAAAVPTFLLLAGWPLAAQFTGPQRISRQVQDPTKFSTDLLNLVLPTPLPADCARGRDPADRRVQRLRTRGDGIPRPAAARSPRCGDRPLLGRSASPRRRRHGGPDVGALAGAVAPHRRVAAARPAAVAGVGQAAAARACAAGTLHGVRLAGGRGGRRDHHRAGDPPRPAAGGPVAAGGGRVAGPAASRSAGAGAVHDAGVLPQLGEPPHRSRRNSARRTVFRQWERGSSDGVGR